MYTRDGVGGWSVGTPDDSVPGNPDVGGQWERCWVAWGKMPRLSLPYNSHSRVSLMPASNTYMVPRSHTIRYPSLYLL